MHTYHNRHYTHGVGLFACAAVAYFLLHDNDDWTLSLIMVAVSSPVILGTVFSGVYTTATRVYILNPFYVRRFRWDEIREFASIKARGYAFSKLGVVRQSGKITQVFGVSGSLYGRRRHKSDDILDTIVTQLNHELQAHQRAQEPAKRIPQEEIALLSNAREMKSGFISTGDLLLDTKRGCWFQNSPAPVAVADAQHVVHFERTQSGFEIALTAEHIAEVQASALDAEACRQAGYYPVEKVTII
jgi:hypothetical protein